MTREARGVTRLRAAVVATAEVTAGRSLNGTSHDDASADAGTIDTDDAHGFDPFPLLSALHTSGARVVVIGQVAGIMHGSTELTGDLDLLWSGDPLEAAAMAAAFAAVGARLADDDRTPLPTTPGSFAGAKVMFTSGTASGDCCTPRLPWGRQDVSSYLDRCEIAAGAGLAIRYLALADLTAMRLAAGRPKDLRRVAELGRPRG